MVHPIRPATAADAPLLAALYAASFPRAWSRAEFAALLVQPGVFGLLAGEAGFILCRAAADECEIITFVVDRSRRRAGLGRALLTAAIDAARSMGTAAMFLEVEERNAAALGLYQAQGFEAAGRRTGYYAGNPPKDALVLRRNLA